jgi:hypothetical protein
VGFDITKDMKNIKNIGYLCLTVVLFLELGSIIGNLSEGYSLFYLFDLSERFGVDNPTFFLYWGSVIGMVFVIREFDKEKIINLLDRGKSSEVSQTNETPKKTNSQTEKGIIRKILNWEPKTFSEFIGLVILFFLIILFQQWFKS